MRDVKKLTQLFFPEVCKKFYIYVVIVQLLLNKSVNGLVQYFF